ncbi:MAG TPA: hypothetical protein VGG74_09205 [Kofleriaceae bacterium]|jgi:hypothetical protein
MQRASVLAVFILIWVACGGHEDHHRGAGSASTPLAVVSDAAIGSAELSVKLGSDGLPITCGEWRAALDKLQTCRALPENARASLQAMYADESKNWSQLPADAKRKLGPICQSGADSILKGAKATCGW